MELKSSSGISCCLQQEATLVSKRERQHHRVFTRLLISDNLQRLAKRLAHQSLSEAL